MGKRYDAEPHNPEYPRNLGATVAKFRTLAKGGLSRLSYEERRAYGEAVEKAILGLQRSALMRATPSHRVNCASGTEYSDGADIHEAMRRKQRAALLAWPDKVRRNRAPDVWQSMYAEAMAEKREREARKEAA